MSLEYVLKKTSSPGGAQIDYRASLNDEQYAAVTAKPGPILVIAGAGSGKTRTLTYRVAYLIENGVEPDNILLLTFTNKASREMLERVGNLLPHDISRIWGGTFHSVANRLLRRHANEVGFGTDFTILDRDDANDLALAALRAAGLDPKNKELPKGAVLCDIFGLASGTGKTVSTIVAEYYPYFSAITGQLETIHRIFRDRKQADNVMDYDDLLVYALRLLREKEELRKFYQEKFQHILVDEYQDTNKIQSDFIDFLAAYHHQVMAVGDDAQSIYSWRGANFENVLTFPQRFPGAREIRIETNYRSTPEILTLANYAIAANTRQFPKNLHAVRPAEKYSKPALICLQDANQQANFICQRIEEIIEEGVEPNEIAVLYRAHFHSMELQMEMTRRRMPFELLSGLRFFEQAHVKDAASFLKFALNPKDELAFKRIAGLMPGVGERTADKLWQKLAEGSDFASLEPPAKALAPWRQWVETHRQISAPELRNRPSEQIQTVIDAIYEDYMKAKFPNFQSRLEDLGQLRAFAQNFERTEDFLAQLALLTNTEDGPRADGPLAGQPCLRLSTVHQAKGLEWKVVFVIMLCDGLFPARRSIETLEGEEEERRLFYVAVTRACDELYLTYPVTRATASFDDRWQEPSRFITGFPRGLVNEWKIKAAPSVWE
ncbi:MAG TPA: ATP-dependent helicase [Candidatus Methylacidiphilales bacterium]|nr:ATP-dependent helicase [Candidatus Methylacidiphilales bacterium]